MASGKDKNDQELEQHNLDKGDGPTEKTEILDGQPEHGNQSHVSEPTADGVIFPGNDSIHDTEDRADADFRPGNENFDINNDQKIAFDKSDGPIAKTEILDGQSEQGILGQANGMTGGDAENYNAGPNWVKTDTPIHDTEERADTDFHQGSDNFDINNDQKIAFDKSDGPIANDKLDRDQIEALKQDNLDKSDGPGPDGPMEIVHLEDDTIQVSGDVVNMANMHTHMDDATAHQDPEGPPQDPQGMGLDRLGTQFDEDGMGDMHTPDDPNDGGEVV